MIHIRIVQGIGVSGERVNVRVSLRRVSVSSSLFSLELVYLMMMIADDYNHH